MKTLNFKQRETIGKAGSFINQLMGNNSTLPEVGKGATEMHFSDRSCYEVIEVSPDFKTVKLEYLTAEYDKNKPGGQGHQDWILKPSGIYVTIIWKYNAWRKICKEIVFTDEFNKLYESSKNREERLKLSKEIFNNGDMFPKLVPGKTKEKFTYPKIRIFFGIKDYYYDWSI